MDYYMGKHDIESQSKANAGAPNNKLIANMCEYVTNTATGYFVGIPITYSSTDESLMGEVQEIFDYNDEQDENAELAKMCSIYGSCVEMMYIDEDTNVRFTKLKPYECILIYENFTNELLAVIRKIETENIEGEKVCNAELWRSNTTSYYENDKGKLTLVDEQDHYFQDVPFVEFKNNEERIGDFEGIISLNDAYNKVQSNTSNLFEYNDDAILKISRIGDVTLEEIIEMRKQGAICLEDGGDIDWLIKGINDIALQNHKKSLENDMHKFSNVPNLNDEKFGGNTSGIAIEYKLWGLEQICANKERKFKRSIQRRIELIVNVLNIKGGKHSYMAIKMKFRRNKPRDLVEATEIVTKLSGEVSKETRLQLLTFVDNAKEELDKLKLESEEERKSFRGGKDDKPKEGHFGVGDEE